MEKHDKLHDKLKVYKEKQDVRTNATEQKLNYAKQAFDEINNELMVDIPKLLEDSDTFFTPTMQNLIYIQGQFWNLLNQFNINLANTTGVHTSKPITMRQVITLREQSAMVKTYSGLNNPYGGENVTNVYTQSHTPQTQPTINTVQNQPQRTGPPLPNRQQPPPNQPSSRATGLWDFTAATESELPFKKGDILIIHERNGSWWKAELNGRQGIIPSNYVQFI